MLCAENSHSKNYSFSRVALKYLSEPRTGTLDIRSLFYLIESFHVIAKKMMPVLACASPQVIIC